MNEYLDELGIVNFEFKKKSPANLNSKTEVRLMIVEIESFNSSFLTNGATRDLLKKMLAAIAIDIDEVICVDNINKINEFNVKIVIVTNKLSDRFKNDNYFIIPHPSEILKTPELKRKAWEVLKEVKKKGLD